MGTMEKSSPRVGRPLFETLYNTRNATRFHHTLSNFRRRPCIHSHLQRIQILNIQSRKTSTRYKSTLEALCHLRGYRIFPLLPGLRHSMYPYQEHPPRFRNRSQPLRNKTFPNSQSQKTRTPLTLFFRPGGPFRNLYGWRYCRVFQFPSRHS